MTTTLLLDAQTHRLLSHLWRGGAVACLWTSPGQRSYWIHPKDLKTAPAATGLNVYFCVHPCSQVPPTNADGEVRKPAFIRSQIVYIAAISCLFAEYDAKDFTDGKAGAWKHIEGLGVPPSVIVDSGGGYHCYWLLREPFTLTTEADRTRADDLQKRWVAFVGSDDGAKDLARVLRVPGSRNWKTERGPEFPTVTIVAADFERLYELDELARLLPAVEVSSVAPVTTRPQPPDPNSSSQERYVRRAVEDELDTLARTNEGGRNDQLNRSAFALGELVGAGVLVRADAEDRLVTVATAIGLPEGEARRTVKSGLAAGEREPRRLPTFTDRRNGTPPAPAQDQGSPRSNGKPTAADNAHLSDPIQAGPDDGIDVIDRGKHDLGNAIYAVQREGGRYMFTDGLGWLWYTGTHWDGDTAEARVHGVITRALKARCRLALDVDDTDLLKAATPSAKHTRDATYHFRHLVTHSTEDFDAVPHLLNVHNGVVDLRSGEMVAHEPSNRFTYCVPTDYLPGERSDLWDRLLLEWFSGDFDLVQYVRRAQGYSITGETREECLFYVRGPGRAGKGTLVNTPAQILGHELAKGIQFDAFTMANDAQNFRLAPLHNARYVSASESKKGEHLDVALVKQLTGRDPITAAFKFKTPFVFTPKFKVWLQSNYPPKGDVDDAAFWYRVRLLKLTKSNLGCEDNTIKDALLQPENRIGVLAWLVYGAMKWYERGLGTPQTVWDATEEAREEQDPIAQWLKDCTIDRSETPQGNGEPYYTTMTVLHDNYTQWCTDNGIRFPLAKNTLCTRLKVKGYENKRSREGASMVTRVWGLELQ